MHLDPAPFHSEIAYGPDGGAAYWLNTSDNIKIRVALWPVEAAKGTVLIFPGRTEFVEKYGQCAKAFAAHGIASLTVDWRGQGLADRLLENPMVGHVEHFSDYQKDVAAMVRAARELNLPRPYFLLAHSMGGAIGLRAVIEGLAVRAVAFSAPMWGIQMAPHLRTMAWALNHLMPRIGKGHQLPPTLKLEHHVLTESFEHNLLTCDRGQYQIMREQLTTHPELSLGGPSYVWLREALLETRHLASRPSPNLPGIAFLGSDERIVDVSEILRRIENWSKGELQLVPNSKHEVLMDKAETSGPVFEQTVQLFLNQNRS